jgi:hypothetical protein
MFDMEFSHTTNSPRKTGQHVQRARITGHAYHITRRNTFALIISSKLEYTRRQNGLEIASFPFFDIRTALFSRQEDSPFKALCISSRCFNFTECKE